MVRVGQVRQRHGQGVGSDRGPCAEGARLFRRPWQAVLPDGLGRPPDHDETDPDGRRTGGRDRHGAWEGGSSRLGLAAVAQPRPDAQQENLQAVEQKCPEIAAARHVGIYRHQPFMAKMLTRLGFIDETSTKTNRAKTTGWAPRGERLVESRTLRPSAHPVRGSARSALKSLHRADFRARLTLHRSPAP